MGPSSSSQGMGHGLNCVVTARRANIGQRVTSQFKYEAFAALFIFTKLKQLTDKILGY
jgi:hypothetical protein